ncbi:hypothetical protein EI94DRAFT_1704460 [Lactarius quietus]|nr:hypothetical protein EI94DRAFT_1704460 [Lactarius quietus]
MDKINSGFRAWELLVYMFGYCPTLLYGTLPCRYWQNFYKSIHGLSHLAQDVACLGPGAYSSQWTLEHTISNLGQEIKQPLNLYANLVNCSPHHSQLSALHMILPDLEPDNPILPQGAVDLGNGYILLRARDETSVRFYDECADAIHAFLVVELGQVQFFFQSEHSGVVCTYVLVSVWSEPDATLLQESVIKVKLIQSVVAMIPMTPCNGDHSPWFFPLEKPVLEITHLGDVATSNHSK